MSSVTSIIDGLKKLYVQKLKPLEVTYHYNDFVSPLLVSDKCIWPRFSCEVDCRFLLTSVSSSSFLHKHLNSFFALLQVTCMVKIH